MPHRRVGRGLTLALLLLALGTAGGWALRTALEPPEALTLTPRPPVAEVENGIVGRTLAIYATAEWEVDEVASIRAAGVLTSSELDGSTLTDAGNPLLTVDLRPVFLGKGSVPAFRDLTVGASGADVEQLQDFLITLGHFKRDIDGRFGVETQEAVLRWQKSMGVTPDGIVRAGDIVWIATTPSRIRLESSVQVGSTVSAGDQIIEVLSSAPSVRIDIQPEQISLLPEGASTRIQITAGSEWLGQVAHLESNPDGSAFAEIGGLAGSSICEADCDLVPLFGALSVPAEVDIVPAVEGSVVPAAAIRTTSEGSTYVVDQTGERVDVVVIAVASGRAVVEGLSPGELVSIAPIEREGGE